MISCYVGNNHRRWDENLPSLQFAINSAPHDTTGRSPFYINTGREPRLPWEIPDEDPTVPEGAIDRSLDVHREELERVKTYATEAQRRQKLYYDLRRSSDEFEVGALVWLERHDLSRAADYHSAKLSPKWEGPYMVTRKQTPLVYALEDAVSGENKGTRHVSQLKYYHIDPTLSFPPTDRDDEPRANQLRNTSNPEDTDGPQYDSMPSLEQSDLEDDHILGEPCCSELESPPREIEEPSNDIENPLWELPFNNRWVREICHRATTRPGGPTCDIYYFPPEEPRTRLRSFYDVAVYLHRYPVSGLSIDNFCFERRPISKPPWERVRRAGETIC